MRIDFHTHCFPDRIAAGAVKKLEKISGLSPLTDGTHGDLCRAMRTWGTDLAVTFHIATNPHQQTSVNQFAAACNQGSTRAFGSVHPEAPDALEELNRVKELGLCGVKLHPDYQEFFVEEERLFPLYERCGELGLMVAFHAGWDPLSPALVHATPQGFAKMLDRFPHLTVILAHMGGFNRWEEVEALILGRKNVYLDTSLAPDHMPKEQFVRMVRGHGAERILYGTDCPWSSGERAVRYIQTSGLTREEQDRIFFGNACRLLGMEGQSI